MKTRQDNNVTDLISLVYAKIETIWLGMVCDEKTR